jgi:hypothetical protein
MLLNILKSPKDLVCQLLAHGRWFSPGNPASSTTKTDRHEYNLNIVESGVKHHQTNKPKSARVNHVSGMRPLIRARTYVVLVIGLYELLGNPTA